LTHLHRTVASSAPEAPAGSPRCCTRWAAADRRPRCPPCSASARAGICCAADNIVTSDSCRVIPHFAGRRRQTLTGTLCIDPAPQTLNLNELTCRDGIAPAAPQVSGSAPVSSLSSSRSCFRVGIAPAWPQLAGRDPAWRTNDSQDQACGSCLTFHNVHMSRSSSYCVVPQVHLVIRRHGWRESLEGPLHDCVTASRTKGAGALGTDHPAVSSINGRGWYARPPTRRLSASLLG